jgi:nucleoside-diphosphate-sugar epimerase
LSSERAGLLLVTGSSGFIGGRLTSRLASLGLPVRATSRRRPASVPDGAEFLPADIGDRDSLSRVLDGVRCVVNVAG